MPLAGKLNYSEMADLLKVVDWGKKSGILLIDYQENRARLFFQNGRLVRAESNRFTGRIGEILVQRKVLDTAQLERALARQREDGGRRKLGEILAEEFSIGDIEIEISLAEHFKAIVLDVLRWPEGSIVFDVEHPGEEERFNLSALDFILNLGIEAGYLAEGE